MLFDLIKEYIFYGYGFDKGIILFFWKKYERVFLKFWRNYVLLVVEKIIVILVENYYYRFILDDYEEL